MREGLDVTLKGCEGAHNRDESFVFECFFEAIEILFLEISDLLCDKDYDLMSWMLL